jgi:hypothetical protein
VRLGALLLLPNRRSSIYLGKDGWWHGWVTIGVKDDGSPDRRHRNARTEAEVTRKVRELESNRDSGHVPGAGRPLTVAQWMEIWLTTIAPAASADPHLTRAAGRAASGLRRDSF